MSWWLTIRNSLWNALMWYWLLSSVNNWRLLKIWWDVIWMQNRLNLTFRYSWRTICWLTFLNLLRVIIWLLSLTHFIMVSFFYKIFNFGKIILRNLNWFKIKKITEEQKWGEVTLSRELVLGRIRDS